MSQVTRIDRLDERIPQRPAVESWDMSLWTDDELDEVIALSDKLRAVMDAEPGLAREAMIARALTPEEMERAAVLVGIANGEERPAERVPTTWTDWPDEWSS